MKSQRSTKDLVLAKEEGGGDVMSLPLPSPTEDVPSKGIDDKPCVEEQHGVGLSNY